MTSLHSSLIPALDLIQALLQEPASPEPKVIVLVVDEKEERLLGVRYEPITEIAALLSLHGIKPESIQSHPTEHIK